LGIQLLARSSGHKHQTFDLQTEAICFLFIKTIDGMIVVVNPVTSSLVSPRDSETPSSS
jgi:hypothetical protein